MSEALCPWFECADRHPDMLSEELSEDIFALNLGALIDHLIEMDSSLSGNAEPIRLAN